MYYEDENYGKLITSVDGFEKGSGSVVITFEDGSTFHMWHSQDCCETVDINDIEGDTNLVGATWQGYDERSESGTENDYGSSTWTFYTIYTNRGYTWVRWLGESNGYYSEGASHGYYAAGESRSYW